MDDNYIEVKIIGKNINNYIKWLIHEKINVFKSKKISRNELNIIIRKVDYQKLFTYSKSYQIKIIKKFGRLKLLDILKNNLIFLICILLSILFLFFLSKIIFSIDVIYNDQEMSNKILKELEKYDIKRFSFKKDYNYIEHVKKQILKDMQDNLEWLEINESGTKYIVKLVERKKPTLERKYKYQSIVASKNAIIKSIQAISGEKNKTINEYVKKDDIVINGIIKKPNNDIIYTRAEGKVLGEVWYKIKIEYPLFYQEEFLTGRNKNVISLSFMNKKLSLFPYKKYKRFKVQSNAIISNNFIPINLYKEKLYEVKTKEEIYTLEQVISRAIDFSKGKMLEKNNKIISFNNIFILSKEQNNSLIKLELFVSTIEDITKIIEIKEENIE